MVIAPSLGVVAFMIPVTGMMTGHRRRHLNQKVVAPTCRTSGCAPGEIPQIVILLWACHPHLGTAQTHFVLSMGVRDTHRNHLVVEAVHLEALDVHCIHFGLGKGPLKGYIPAGETSTLRIPRPGAPGAPAGRKGSSLASAKKLAGAGRGELQETTSAHGSSGTFAMSRDVSRTPQKTKVERRLILGRPFLGLSLAWETKGKPGPLFGVPRFSNNPNSTSSQLHVMGGYKPLRSWESPDRFNRHDAATSSVQAPNPFLFY